MDHLHDSNCLTLANIELPGFVKVASETPRFFAYSDGRQSFFPIDTPSNAWLSAAYFEKNAAEQLSEDDFVDVHDRILDALKLHNISYTSPFGVEKVAEDVYTFEKFASEAKVFEQNYSHILPEERHKTAKELLNRYQALKDAGAEVSGSLPKLVEDYAGDHLKQDWPEEVKLRATRIDDKEGKEAYNELAKSTETKDVILKLVELLDRKFGIDKYYDRGISDPYRALLSMQPPVKEKVIIMVVNGKDYDLDKVASFNPLDLADQFGGNILAGLIHDRNAYLKDAPDFVKVAVAQLIDERES